MKLLPIALIAALTANAQADMSMLPMDSTTHKVTYTKVVQVEDGAKKDVLYTRAKTWFVNTFKDAKNVIQMDDKEAGQVMGKSNFKTEFTLKALTTSYPVYFTITLLVKDGKYKYVFTDFRVDDKLPLEETVERTGESAKTIYNQVYSKVIETMKGIIDGLNKAMNNAGTAKADW